jgi:DNA-binding MarR family transcriptional regulator
MERVIGPQKNIDEKIIFIFDKISQIIHSLRWNVGFRNNLTPLQIQIITLLAEKPSLKSGVKEISDELGLSMPTISDTVKVLLRKGYIEILINKLDKRYKDIYLTQIGKRFFEDEILKVREESKKGLGVLKEEEKREFFIYLLKIISEFQEKGILKVVRICLNCENFIFNRYPGTERPHFCKLTNRRLAEHEFKVNCEGNIPGFKFSQDKEN